MCTGLCQFALGGFTDRLRSLNPMADENRFGLTFWHAKKMKVVALVGA